MSHAAETARTAPGSDTTHGDTSRSDTSHSDTSHSPQRRLAAVLFDMDGTLFDSEKLWDVSLDELAAHLGGVMTPELRRSLVGSNLAESVTMVHDALGVHADPHESGQFLLRRTKELFGPGMQWKLGAVDLVGAVRAAEIPRAIVTSTPRELTDVALANFPVGSFDVVICGDEVTHTKPHPESYLSAAARLGADPRDSVAIEDSPRGIASAEAAGCPVVAVPSEVPVPSAPGRIVIDSLVGVTVDWLRTLPARFAG